MGELNISMSGSIKTIQGTSDLGEYIGEFEYTTNFTFIGSNISKSINSKPIPLTASIVFRYKFDYKAIPKYGLKTVELIAKETNGSEIKEGVRNELRGRSYYLDYRLFPFKDVEIRVDISFVISPRGSIRIDYIGEIGNVVTSSLPTQLTSSLLDNIVQVLISTDSYTGNNLAQCVMTAKDFCVTQYLPKVKNYVKADGCTYASKVTYITNKYYQPNQSLNILIAMSIFAVLRYFLWKLITGKFTLEILRDRYTLLFMKVLSLSPYSNYIEVFQTLLLGFNNYFIY